MPKVSWASPSMHRESKCNSSRWWFLGRFNSLFSMLVTDHLAYSLIWLIVSNSLCCLFQLGKITGKSFKFLKWVYLLAQQMHSSRRVILKALQSRLLHIAWSKGGKKNKKQNKTMFSPSTSPSSPQTHSKWRSFHIITTICVYVSGWKKRLLSVNRYLLTKTDF